MRAAIADARHRWHRWHRWPAFVQAAGEDGPASYLSAITGPSWPHGVRSATSLALVARFHERFADQAVSVAKRLDFVTTG